MSQLDGALWEDYLKIELPQLWTAYTVEHLSEYEAERFAAGIFRDEDGNKYPDFRLTHKNESCKERIYIDAKRKKGTVFQNRDYVTCDKTFVESYNNIIQKDIANGWNAEGLLLFWHEKSGAYYAPIDPHNWHNFGNNGYGSAITGQWWIKQLKQDKFQAHEYDSFADVVASSNKTTYHQLDDWVNSFKET
jgi:hypothetical protein